LKRFRPLILTQYVRLEYLKAFAAALFFFIALVILVRLLDKDLKYFDEDISYLEAILVVIYQAPRRIMEVVPLATFLSTFFVLGRMAQNNEITAMKAAGVSLYRIITPILFSTFIICILFFFFYDQVASPANHRANQLEKQIPLRRSRNVVFKGQNNRDFFIQALDLENRTIDRMTIYEYNSYGALARLIFANSATWSPNYWHLVKGFIRTFDDGVEVSFERFAAKNIPRLEEPELFAGSDKEPSAMTIKELRRQIRYKQQAGQSTRVEQVRLHHKYAYPFAAFVVVLIGAPIAVRFGQAGFFAGLLMAFFLVFMYWGLSLATLEGFGENGKLPPVVACWGANVLYAVIGGILIWKTPK
jgi:LPS export ABC transporter permease LptG